MIILNCFMWWFLDSPTSTHLNITGFVCWYCFFFVYQNTYLTLSAFMFGTFLLRDKGGNCPTNGMLCPLPPCDLVVNFFVILCYHRHSSTPFVVGHDNYCTVIYIIFYIAVSNWLKSRLLVQYLLRLRFGTAAYLNVLTNWLLMM